MSTFSSPDLPPERKINGRAPDQNFEDDEELFFRFDAIDGDKVGTQCIRFPDQSVERGKYGKWEWVLLPRFQTWGAARFTVKDVPKSLLSPGNSKCDFKVFHDPDADDDNYPHCEVRAFKDGVHIPASKKSKIHEQIKLDYRMRLSERSHVMKKPGS